MNTRTCVSYAGRLGARNPSDDDPSEGSLANSGDELGEFNSPARASGLLLNAAAQFGRASGVP